MFVLSAFVALLSAVPTTLSAPVDNSVMSADPYNCGYVRTRPSSSVVAGIFALDRCEPFFYNETISDYQDAFAYMLYGGCACRFYSYIHRKLQSTLLNDIRDAGDCSASSPVPVYTGSTDRWREPLFAEPRPTWYNCHESK